MIQQLLRDGLTRSLGAALMSDDRLEGLLRPTLERCELPPEEIDRVIDEARTNLGRWQREVGGQIVGVVGTGVGAGLGVFLRTLGLPTRDEIAELERRVEALERPPRKASARRASRKSPAKPAPRRRKPAEET